jgi:4-amino-4-deoxy-L-arabinose transferase-like glycosyltransferase
MTGLFDGIIAAILAAIVYFITVRVIRVRTSPDESAWLIRVFFWTLLLRYVLALFLNFYAGDSAFAAAFWGDSGQYDEGGQLLALKWSGEPVLTPGLSSAVSGFGWVYFVGAFYYVFGRNQLLVQFLNGWIGAVTVVVIYVIAQKLFDRRAARWAALFMAFFPQMVFWSAGMYKDPAILFCIAICMYAVLNLRERLSVADLLRFTIAELALVTLRFYIAYFVAFAAVAAFLFGYRGGGVRSLLRFVVLLGTFLLALNLAVERETLERQTSYLTLERAQVTRTDQAMWSESGFGQQQNVSTMAGAVAALPVGIVYLLFAPFPWAISGLRQALVLPETLVWYALMPALARGFLHAIRYKFRAVLPILTFAITLTMAYAIMQGNVGTAYRQRTQISMFFFVFMASGLVEKERQRERNRGGAAPYASHG